jgi:hypothetical protein
MSSTAVLRDTAQQAAEQRFAESTAKSLEQRAGASAIHDAPISADTFANLNEAAAAATTAVQAQMVEKMTTTTRDLTSLAQGSVEALLQASQILATGSQDLFREIMASGQAAYAQALSGLSAVAAAKTARERIDLQVGLVRASTTRAIAEGGRFTTASLDLAEKASSPFTVQATRAAEVFTSIKV